MRHHQRSREASAAGREAGVPDVIQGIEEAEKEACGDKEEATQGISSHFGI